MKWFLVGIGLLLGLVAVVWFASGVRLRDFVRPVLRLSWPIFFGMLAVVALMLVAGWLTERISVRPLVER